MGPAVLPGSLAGEPAYERASTALAHKTSLPKQARRQTAGADCRPHVVKVNNGVYSRRDPSGAVQIERRFQSFTWIWSISPPSEGIEMQVLERGVIQLNARLSF